MSASEASIYSRFLPTPSARRATFMQKQYYDEW